MQAPGPEGGAHSPSFLGERVNMPLTTLQWLLSPPHTPHLSSCLLEPITPSQPTFCEEEAGLQCTPRPSPLGIWLDCDPWTLTPVPWVSPFQ